MYSIVKTKKAMQIVVCLYYNFLIIGSTTEQLRLLIHRISIYIQGILFHTSFEKKILLLPNGKDDINQQKNYKKKQKKVRKHDFRLKTRSFL